VKPAQAHAVLVLDHDTKTGGTGVAAGGTIREDPERFAQSRTRMRPQCSQCTISSPLRRICMPEDVTVTRHAEHALLTTFATGGFIRIRL
jgi:hypothetical protein